MATEWSQLPEESDRAYSAFRVWLEQEPPRLHKRVVEQGYARKSVREWKRKYRWIERTLAYDTFVQRRQLEAELAQNEAQNADYSEAITNSLRAKLSTIDMILNEELQAIRAAQVEGEELDVLRVKRLLTAIGEADSLARRSAAMPTAFRSKIVEDAPRDIAPQIYEIGGRNEDDDE